MKNAFCLAAALCFLAPMAMASTVNQIRLVGGQELTFEQKTKKKFELVQRDLYAKVHYEQELGEEIERIRSENLIEESDLVSGRLTLGKRSEVYIYDSTNKVSGTVKADINASMFGDLRSLEISSANNRYLNDRSYNRLMTDIIESSAFLNGTLEHSSTLSKIRCKKIGEKKLKCVSTFEYVVKEDAARNAAYEKRKKKILGL